MNITKELKNKLKEKNIDVTEFEINQPDLNILNNGICRIIFMWNKIINIADGTTNLIENICRSGFDLKNVILENPDFSRNTRRDLQKTTLNVLFKSRLKNIDKLPEIKEKKVYRSCGGGNNSDTEKEKPVILEEKKEKKKSKKIGGE